MAHVNYNNFCQQELTNLIQHLSYFFNSTSNLEQLKSVLILKHLCVKENNNILLINQIIIDTGIVKSLIKILSKCENPRLQYECLWPLGSIAMSSYKHQKYLVQQNIHKMLFQLIQHASDYFIKQIAMLILQSLSSFFGQCLLDHGILNLISKVCYKYNSDYITNYKYDKHIINDTKNAICEFIINFIINNV